MLSIEKLRSGYGPLEVLNGVSLDVEKGQAVCVIGPNGAGKSTLLKTISGLIPAKSGRIVFDGQDITRWRPERIVKAGISQVPEGRQVFATLTVADNLLLGAYCHYKNRGRAVQRDMDGVFEIFPLLKERRKQTAGTLSGGEQQMLAIGRALMSGPKLLLLDEPSLGLAPLITEQIFLAIKEFPNNGTPVVLVEQNARAALTTAQKGYVIETGRIVVEGPTHLLLQDKRIIESYLGGPTKRSDMG